ncbi:MAG: metallophosphatase family protein [Candidatus Omnitrophica bacterium]|nr:metallophosphatase family protein [Candidatus Omnitrophota bacterium]
MRYGIFSDVHSNIEALDTVLEAFKNESVDTYLCIGDVVGYATQPNECVEKVRRIASITVAGNHDWAAVNLFSLDNFNDFAKQALLWTRKELNDSSTNFLGSLKLMYKNDDLTLVHGTLDAPEGFDYMVNSEIAKRSFLLMGNDVCFVGHTHIAGVFIDKSVNYINFKRGGAITLERGNKYIVNVGSIGQPRDGNPNASYCVFDSEKREVAIKRKAYNIESTRKKILDKGLPRFLADRLLIGR